MVLPIVLVYLELELLYPFTPVLVVQLGAEYPLFALSVSGVTIPSIVMLPSSMMIDLFGKLSALAVLIPNRLKGNIIVIIRNIKKYGLLFIINSHPLHDLLSNYTDCNEWDAGIIPRFDN
ncbi:hypothetical protein D3C73_1090070 [compost metagenome]